MRDCEHANKLNVDSCGCISSDCIVCVLDWRNARSISYSSFGHTNCSLEYRMYVCNGTGSMSPLNELGKMVGNWYQRFCDTSAGGNGSVRHYLKRSFTQKTDASDAIRGRSWCRIANKHRMRRSRRSGRFLNQRVSRRPANTRRHRYTEDHVSFYSALMLCAPRVLTEGMYRNGVECTAL